MKGASNRQRRSIQPNSDPQDNPGRKTQSYQQGHQNESKARKGQYIRLHDEDVGDVFLFTGDPIADQRRELIPQDIQQLANRQQLKAPAQVCPGRL